MSLAEEVDSLALRVAQEFNAVRSEGGGAAASETVAGIAELATQAETNTGTDDARIVTPLKLKTRLDSYTKWNGLTSTAYYKERRNILDFSSTAGNVTGELVIQTNIIVPAAGSTPMALLHVRGQNLLGVDGIIDLKVRVQIANGVVTTPDALDMGTYPIAQVRAFKRTSDNAFALVISPSTDWDFIKFTVDGSFGNGYVTDAELDGWSATITSDLSALTALTTSTATLFSYVDKTLFDAAWFKEECRVATTANIDLTTGGLLTIDGITVGANNRVLVKNQTAPAENGIYLAQSGTWTRATDADTTVKCSPIMTMITQGTQTGTIWQNKFNLGSTLGTTAMPFTRVLDSTLAGADQASETAKGIIELATQAETDTGDDDTRAVTPLKLATRLGTWSVSAESVEFSPAAGIVATDVQSGLEEVAEKIVSRGIQTITPVGTGQTISFDATTEPHKYVVQNSGVTVTSSTITGGVLGQVITITLERANSANAFSWPTNVSEYWDPPLARGGSTPITRTFMCYASALADPPGYWIEIARGEPDPYIEDTTAYGRALTLLNDQTELMALLQAASETVQGKIELATQTEVNTGTDNARAVTPLKLQTRLAAYAQPLDATLTALAGTSFSVADRIPYTTGADAFSTAVITSAARSLIAQATVAEMRATLQAKDLRPTINNQSGTTYTLVLTDENQHIQLTNNGGTITVTVPANATVAFPVGTEIEFTLIGTSVCNFVAAGGVTINSRGDSLSIAQQYGVVKLRKRSADMWVLSGDLAPDAIALPVAASIPSGTPDGTIVVRY